MLPLSFSKIIIFKRYPCLGSLFAIRVNILKIGNVSWKPVYHCPLNKHCPRIDCMSSYRLHNIQGHAVYTRTYSLYEDNVWTCPRLLDTEFYVLHLSMTMVHCSSIVLTIFATNRSRSVR